MRQYTCDVCGQPMPPAYGRPIGRRPGLLAAANVKDVCPVCADRGKDLDMAGMVLAAWKELVGASLPVPQVPAEQPPKPGAGRKTLGERDIKADTMLRLKAYRKKKGLGCLSQVAKLAGPDMSDDILRDVLIGGAVLDLSRWRNIAKALDKLEGGDK